MVKWLHTIQHNPFSNAGSCQLNFQNDFTSAKFAKGLKATIQHAHAYL